MHSQRCAGSLRRPLASFNKRHCQRHDCGYKATEWITTRSLLDQPSEFNWQRQTLFSIRMYRVGTITHQPHQYSACQNKLQRNFLRYVTLILHGQEPLLGNSQKRRRPAIKCRPFNNSEPTRRYKRPPEVMPPNPDSQHGIP
jgi:hypothetical protein